MTGASLLIGVFFSLGCYFSLFPARRHGLQGEW
jgi:hypothetical protein